MTKKIRVAILFGGRSAEHEISIRSARNILKVINKRKYEVILIGIDQSGKWLNPEQSLKLLGNTDARPQLSARDDLRSALPHANLLTGVDVVFPILHGPFGEDGTVQGLLKLANIPFVGAGVLGSAVGMDKDVMKRLLRDAKIPIGRFIVFRHGDLVDFDKVRAEIGLPFFVKPANMGSSIGVSKVKNKDDFRNAVDCAFQYDTKILMEEFIEGRELECAVLGNSNPIASSVGEILPGHEFYSYEAKYLDENSASLIIPAGILKKTAAHAQSLAIKTFQTLSCEGLGRIDFFLTKNGKLLVNEINTMPGFTDSSMYPMLWKYSGISYQKLIDQLIELAFERTAQEKALRTSRNF